MRKRFAITLIVVSTFVYGTIFVMAKRYDTGFFDEMTNQVNRMALNMSKRDEVALTKLTLKTILENEHPPDLWHGLIARSKRYDHQELFYHYKVWTLKSNLSMKDISRSYPINESTKDGHTIINIRYGKLKKVLQFPIMKGNAGNLIVGLFFPINEMPFSADYNNDKIIDYKDVIRARKVGSKAR